MSFFSKIPPNDGATRQKRQISTQQERSALLMVHGAALKVKHGELDAALELYDEARCTRENTGSLETPAMVLLYSQASALR